VTILRKCTLPAVLIVAAVICAYLVCMARRRAPERRIAEAVSKARYEEAKRLLADYFARRDLWAECANEREVLAKELGPREAYPLVVTPSPDAFDWIERADLYHRIAAEVAGGTASPADKALKLFRWTVRNVQSSGGPGEAEDAGVFPRDVLLRGYGLCDRTAWVYAALLQAAGIEACIIYLRDPETKVSYHTIAGAAVEGALYLFDTYAGLPVVSKTPSKTHSILMLKAVLHDPAALDSFDLDGERFPMKGADFTRATVFVPFEPEMILPATRIAQGVLARGGYPICFHHSWKEDLGRLSALVFGGGRFHTRGPVVTSEESTNQVALWDFPFRIGWLRAHDAKYRARLEQLGKRAEGWRAARLAQLTGRYEQARRLCAQAGTQEDVDYLFVLTAFEQGGYEECIDRAKQYLAGYERGLWRESVKFLLAEALLAADKQAGALDALESVEGSRRLRARMWIEALREEGRPPAFQF